MVSLQRPASPGAVVSVADKYIAADVAITATVSAAAQIELANSPCHVVLVGLPFASFVLPRKTNKKNRNTNNKPFARQLDSSGWQCGLLY